MVPLRVMGLCSNILFFGYGVSGDLLPIMILHGCLFPLNLLRLVEAVKLRQRIRLMARAEFNISALLPFMTEQRVSGDEYLFHINEEARDIYYLASGRVRIDELEIEIGAGHLVGEIAMFSPERRRTQSVRCLEDCVFFRIGEARILELYAENPEFGLYLVKMIVSRLLRNLDQKKRAEPA